jgi:hypothetical protein
MCEAIGFANNALSAVRHLGRILKLSGRLEEAAVVHTFVAAHGAPTPFSRAASQFELAKIAAQLGPAAIEEARERAAAMDVASVAEFALSAMKESRASRLPAIGAGVAAAG